MRLCDIDALIAEYDKVHVGAAGKARQLMVDAPTIDAVPVVKCSHCKKYDRHNHRCKWWNHGVSNVDWCSYAEKDGDNDA